MELQGVRPARFSFSRKSQPSLPCCNKAIQSLQFEISKLRKQLEGSEWKSNQSDSNGEPPLGQEDLLHPYKCHTSFSRTVHHDADEKSEGEEMKAAEREVQEVIRAAKDEQIRPASTKQAASFRRSRPERGASTRFMDSQCMPTQHKHSHIPASFAAGVGVLGGPTLRGPYTGTPYRISCDTDGQEKPSFLSPRLIPSAGANYTGIPVDQNLNCWPLGYQLRDPPPTKKQLYWCLCRGCPCSAVWPPEELYYLTPTSDPFYHV
ncbi:uncharacterized protein LOC125712556 [Brienomyrus brachyistius]|uniref:uncharacterized protein LOC125712556 n=1 Tax=Brienomyrus brachyistius TaxID=42636 RepID=UPI0020B1F15D|nr:uncharacterized protein LOC125712556 [Brienomyrus brachyistius]XP_048838706.1 uncharacterized protein LOC125712556 [Brienomyrus brachyistius]XP_048838715.1 uncharacterized protein LOC125712556 [Brienomyrus brachyistius]